MNAAQTAKVAEARAVLTQLGFSHSQSNERSALVLLCVLELAPTKPWARASGAKRWQTHQIMQWFRDYYGKDYKPNSRETVRRRTLHQFVAARLVLYNPDDPSRAVNSQLNCYQIAPAALALLRTHDKDDFDMRVATYLASKPGLTAQHARTRGMEQIAVTLAGGGTVTLTAGGQNVLIKAIVEQFCPRWTPGGRILYVGDAGRDDPVFDTKGFEDLGVQLNKRGKLPDLVIYMTDRNWLVLVEAASSHGPVDGKRHVELAKLFADCTAGLVYVSCFPSRAVMRKFLADISWETEVWCAEDPTHLIHFNGERFLGPHV